MFPINFNIVLRTKFYSFNFLFDLLQKYVDEFSKQVIESFLNPKAKKGYICHLR